MLRQTTLLAHNEKLLVCRHFLSMICREAMIIIWGRRGVAKARKPITKRLFCLQKRNKYVQSKSITKSEFLKEND